MKKIIVFYLFTFSVYSQNDLHDLHNLLKSCKNTSEINISKSNKTKFVIGQNELNSTNSNEVIEVYNDIIAKSEFYIIPINITNEYNIYVKIPVTINEEKCNALIPNAFDFYLIYNKKSDTIYRINCKGACGTVYKKSKNKLVVSSYFDELVNDIFELDKSLKDLF